MSDRGSYYVVGFVHGITATVVVWFVLYLVWQAP